MVKGNVSTIKDYIEAYKVYLENSESVPDELYEKMFYVDGNIGKIKIIGDFETGLLEPTNNGDLRGKFNFIDYDGDLKIERCSIDVYRERVDSTTYSTSWKNISEIPDPYASVLKATVEKFNNLNEEGN